MTEMDDIDMVAAEYVLGTLDAVERSAVATRRVADRDLDRAIADWEERLAPLAAAVGNVAPAAAVKASVMATIAGVPASAAQTSRVQPASAVVVSLRRRVAVWRGAAIGAGALAAGLAGLIVYRDGLLLGAVQQAAAPQSYVAVLQKDALSPAFLMTVDLTARTFTVRPVAAQHQAGKSYELWLVHDKLGGPKSLGLVGEKASVRPPTLAAYKPLDIETATYAVSLEPEGGSPTGAPTGPVLFAGKLFQSQP